MGVMAVQPLLCATPRQYSCTMRCLEPQESLHAVPVEHACRLMTSQEPTACSRPVGTAPPHLGLAVTSCWMLLPCTRWPSGVVHAIVTL